MDGARFDLVTRTVTAAGSRRGALSALLGGTLGLALGASSVDEGMAKKKKCPPCKKRKKGKCKKNKPNGTPCPEGTCQGGRCAPPSCTDGVKNGSETGVDCGGATCPRCANGQGCTNRDDCQSAMCNLQVNTCQECTTFNDCGSDSFGQCPCYTTMQGAKVCSKGGIPQTVTSCTLCPAPNNCVQLGPDLYCVGRCGT